MSGKKLFLILIILGALLGVDYLLYRLIETESPATVAEKTVLDAKNATYTVEGQEITLVNGRFENTQYFGNEAKGDFNGDGIDDVALLLTQDSAGTGRFYYVAAVISSGSGFSGTNAIFLGDRIAPQTTEFINGEIIVNYADRNQGEPMTAEPSVGVSRDFEVLSGRLVEIKK